MEQELITLTQRIVKDTMEKLAEKLRFVGRRLRFEDDTFVFEGENRYNPELWSIDTQYKKNR